VSTGSRLPTWVDVTSSSRILYGRPSASVSGTYLVNVVASDSRGGSTYETINITVKSTYDAGSVFILSIFVILPILLMVGYFGAIMFMPHESNKYAFDLQDFLKEYDPDYSKRQIMEQDTEDKPI